MGRLRPAAVGRRSCARGGGLSPAISGARNQLAQTRPSSPRLLVGAGATPLAQRSGPARAFGLGMSACAATPHPQQRVFWSKRSSAEEARLC